MRYINLRRSSWISLAVFWLVTLNGSLVFGNKEVADEIFEESAWGRSFTDWTPWIYNELFGWIYLHANSTVSSYSVWTQDLGWIQSSTDSFPEVQLKDFFRDTGSNGLVLLDLNHSDQHRFYSYESKNWYFVPKTHYGRFATFPKSEIIKILGYIENDLIPEEFRGYTHTEIFYPNWPDDKNTSWEIVTSFENYTLQRITSDVGLEVWIYNQADGYFYLSKVVFNSFAKTEINHPNGRVKVTRDGNLFTFSYENTFGKVTRIETLPMLKVNSTQ